ncbi:MAG: Omp28-related outer membrane protein, partial [Flavobacteriaceae bacterium]|nr:Omp28-related outer membrane protein [Flavobacteriaceae bacterium]
MIKKLLSLTFMVLMFGISFGQTIVSTAPENKKVVLEEFTGINCVFCPQGHAIAKAIQDNNPGNVFLINIHTGSFANPNTGQPDFRTPFGSAIASQSQLVGYPAGTVNRHYFPGQAQNGGTGTAMSRNQWTSAANEILGESSYLNMAVEADIDVQTNELTVHVEAYYTGNSPEATNMLNVVLLQNNTLGPQTGGNMGNEYVHQHRLIHMVTGQWGESISPTTTGTFIDRTYTYTIPADYNDIPCYIEDLELVVFMTETTQELISGNGAFPTYSNFPFQNDVTAR